MSTGVPEDVSAAERESAEHSIEFLTPDEVRDDLAYLVAGVETFLPVRDGEEAAGWLYVQAMRRARLECERAREILGHYPLCEALAVTRYDLWKASATEAEYCTCDNWLER